MTHRISRRFTALVTALATAASLTVPAPLSVLHAQNLPNLGDESGSILSPALERRIGEGYYREIRADSSYVEDGELKTYIEDLGRQLVAAGPEPGMDVEFFMIRDDAINAFAMIGGYIGVNTGLIASAQSESEAASVLGHEIGHLTQKHLARGIAAGQRASVATMVASALCLLAARSNSQVTQGCLLAAQAGAVANQLAYSRDFEREADRIGFDILLKGGFDVSAMPVFFERLQRAGRIVESNAPVYVRSHPLTTERIADVRNRVQNTRYRQRVDSLAFPLVRAKLRALRDTSVDGLRDAIKDFETQLKERTYANEAATRYGYAQALLAAREVTRAREELQKIPRSFNHLMLETLSVRITAATGNVVGANGAVDGYRALVAKYPTTRHLQFSLIESLQTAGRHDEALKLLRDQLQTTRSDPNIYLLQARSFAATGKRMSEFQAAGEYQVLMGRPQFAIEQLQIARCAKDGDFYQSSIIDARIRTLWDLMNEDRLERQRLGQPEQGGPGGPGGATRAAGPTPRNTPEAKC
jgi:beta-barrel assembly-enhancing protease